MTQYKGGSGTATDDADWEAQVAITAALASDDPAAAFRAISGIPKTTGEPDQRAHWALFHHRSPGAAANARGVAAARSRFNQTEDLANREAARRHIFETHKLPSEVEESALDSSPTINLMGNTKSFQRVEIKDADQGTVEAVFSTFDAIDADGDVTVQGAFDDGAPVRISAYGHESWFGALPVGRGVIGSTEKEAILDGRFFMDTAHGRATFETVKAMSEPPGLQEWSYAFDPLESESGQFEEQDVRFLKKLKVHEVSPVLLGAGVGTRTLAVKEGKRFSEHAATVMADVRQLIERASEIKALRAEGGKAPSERSLELLTWLEDDLKQLSELLRPGPDAEDVQRAMRREFARFVQITQGVDAA